MFAECLKTVVLKYRIWKILQVAIERICSVATFA